MNSENFEIGLGNNDISIRNNAKADFISFWNERAKLLKWFKPWEKTIDWNPPFAKWFVGGQITASYNALDVNQQEKSSKTAIFWEGEDGSSRIITYGDLYTHVKKFANALKFHAPRYEKITVLGPAPAPISLLRGKHRYRFLIKSSKNINIQKVVKNWINKLKKPASIRLIIDIEPYSFL